MADTSAYLGFLVGFLGAAPLAWSALTSSFDENVGDATMGVARFAGALVVSGLFTGAIGYGLGAAWGFVWEKRHRARNPRAKPEAGADRASETAAKPAETVASVARVWQRQAQEAAVALQRFDAPDEVRDLPSARFELVRVGGAVLGRATCAPGWRWSKHVGPAVGAIRCTVEEAGLVISGEATVEMDDGTSHRLVPGTIFHIPSRPHDSHVVGDVPFVAVHFIGADRYSRSSPT
jgi:quercetin dioxygenase-like cupin family protein